MQAAYSTHVNRTPNASAGTGGAINITVAGTDPVLMVGVALKSATETVSALSWSLGGGTPVLVKAARTGTAYSAIWKIPAPAAGAGTLTVTLSGSVVWQADVALFVGADQTDPSPAADGVSSTVNTQTTVTLTPTNLRSNDASFGIGGSDQFDPTGVTPNQIYLNATTAINLQTGYATGTTGVGFTYSDPGSNNYARVAVRIVAAVPLIDSVSDRHVTDGQSGIVIDGHNFDTQGAGSRVLLSPSDDVDDAGAVEQTVTAWAAASITFTAVRDSLALDTPLYLFVLTDDGLSNAAGSAFEFYAPYVAPAASITHAFVSAIPDEAPAGRVRPSDWNDPHVIAGLEPDLGRPETDGFLASDHAGAREWRQPATSTAPSTATSTGIPGQIAFDATHVYVCTAVDTWKRATIASW